VVFITLKRLANAHGQTVIDSQILLTNFPAFLPAATANLYFSVARLLKRAILFYNRKFVTAKNF
jgi:hypothetical protein